MTPAVLLAACALPASMLLSALAIRYAMRRSMLDLPGARRSHEQPTPRGGGIAPVLVVLMGGAWLLTRDVQAASSLSPCLCGLAAVAGIGWLDDHRPLPSWVRLVVHAVAAVIACIALCGMPRTGAQIALAAIEVSAIAGIVNAWNFMDGIDGLATSQAGLVVAALLVGGWLSGAWQGLCVLSLAAIAGFLPFNFPRARIFLGDSGSGALGYLVAILLLRSVCSGAMPWPLALLPVSAFLLDAGMTLSSRVLRGKAWWRPHREHLYQWLVRGGRSHAEVAGWYALWTLTSSVLAMVASRYAPAVGLALTIVVLLSGGSLWLGSRNRLWMVARQRR